MLYTKLIIKDKTEFIGYIPHYQNNNVDLWFKRIREFKHNEKIFKTNINLFKFYFTMFWAFNISFILGIYVSFFYLHDYVSPMYASVVYLFFWSLLFLAKKHKSVYIKSRFYLNDFTTALLEHILAILDIVCFNWYYLYIWATTKDVFSKEKIKVLVDASGIAKTKSKKVGFDDIKYPLVYFTKEVTNSFKTANAKYYIDNSKIEVIERTDKEYKKLLEWPVKMVKIYKWAYIVGLILIIISFVIFWSLW